MAISLATIRRQQIPLMVSGRQARLAGEHRASGDRLFSWKVRSSGLPAFGTKGTLTVVRAYPSNLPRSQVRPRSGRSSARVREAGPPSECCSDPRRGPHRHLRMVLREPCGVFLGTGTLFDAADREPKVAAALHANHDGRGPCALEHIVAWSRRRSAHRGRRPAHARDSSEAQSDAGLAAYHDHAIRAVVTLRARADRPRQSTALRKRPTFPLERLE